MTHMMKSALTALAVFAIGSAVQAQAITPEADGTISGGTLVETGVTTEQTSEGLVVKFLPTARQRWVNAAYTGTFDLSGYSAIEISLTNVGTVTSKISVRADNPGPVSEKPWNMGVAYDPMEPGETKTLRIDFGYNNFRDQVESYPLDPSNINSIMVSIRRPDTEGVAFRINSIKAVK